MSTQLAEQKIPVMEGFRPANLDWAPDRVVVGNVCRRDHVEVLAATERHIPLVSFPALLSELFLTSRRSVVVAGTHGKTTTSSMAAHVLKVGGVNPSHYVGAEIPILGLAKRTDTLYYDDGREITIPVTSTNVATKGLEA